MKTIRIKFLDFNKGSYTTDLGYEYFCTILRKKYIVELSDNPDYIIYSVFGQEHLNPKYNDTVKIFFTTECYTPNFNHCDYGIGYDRMKFDDRYFRLPLFSLFQYRKFFDMIITRKPYTKEDIKGKTDFCNYVVSNCFVKDRRTEIFLKLSEYKKVNSGGRYMNNIGGAVKDKFAFQQKHKFSIAFENTSYTGYCTEKIVEAFAAGTIPIYWGDPKAVEDFNEKAFINCHKYDSLDDVVEVVKKIDADDDLYLSILNEPIVKYKDGDIDNFLFNIFDQPLDKAFRRPRSMYTDAVEQMVYRHWFFEKYIYKYYKKVKNQIFRLRNNTMLSSKQTK